MSGRSREVLQVMKLSQHAILPRRGSSLAAGYDLSSAYDCVIPAKGKGVVKTDLAIAIPHGCYARVAPRSGLAVKHFIDTGAGVIDEDYRGNVGIVLFNHSDEDFLVKPGDRVAQLVLERISYADIEEVKELTTTERGAGGFGSTGIEKHLHDDLGKERMVEPETEDNSDAAAEAERVFAAAQWLETQNILTPEECQSLKKAIFHLDPKRYALLSLLLQNVSMKSDFATLKSWLSTFSQK